MYEYKSEYKYINIYMLIIEEKRDTSYNTTQWGNSAIMPKHLAD
jgi:hypothetical protein